MSSKKKISKISYWTIILSLTAAVATAIGFLAFFGMLEIFPVAVYAGGAFAYAAGAFVLAGVVDGQVFFKSISTGISNIKLLFSKEAVLLNLLEKKLTEKPSAAASEFEKDLFNLYRLKKLYKHKDLTHSDHMVKLECKQKIRRLHKILFQMLDGKTIPSDKTQAYFENSDGSQSLRDKLKKDLPHSKTKRLYLQLSFLISMAAGIGFGFATIASLDGALALSILNLGATSTLTLGLAQLVWPLAIAATIGYTFLIFSTFSTILVNDTVEAWQTKIKAWYKHDNKNYTGLKNVGLTVFVAVALTLGLLATLATAGTWWFAVETGANLLRPAVPYAKLIRNVFVPTAAAATLFFSIRNTLDSLNQIIPWLKASPTVKKPVEKPAHQEEVLTPVLTWTQRNKPFHRLAAIITYPYMMFMLIGHTLAMGVTGDRTPGLNQWGKIASAIIGAVSDFFVDFHFFIKTHGHKHEHDEHACEHDEHDEHEHDEHDHNHGLIPLILLRTVISPILLGATLWDFFSSDQEKDFKNFKKDFKVNFGFPIKEQLTPAENAETADLSWKVQGTRLQTDVLLIYRLGKHINISSDTGQKTALEAIKTEICSDKPSPDKIDQACTTLKNSKSSSFFGSTPVPHRNLITQVEAFSEYLPRT